MFLPSVSIGVSDYVRYDYLQATEAAVMEKLFAQYVAGLVAENVPLPTNQKRNVIDMDISGGGDGHTFVVRILVSTTSNAATSWSYNVLPGVKGSFWMGSDAEALSDYQEAAIAALRMNNSIESIAVGLAGAAKGTRFMAFMAAHVFQQE